MRQLAVSACVLSVACAAAICADSPAQLLFNRIREKIRAEIDKSPRYTCVETVTRHQYRPPQGSYRSSCAAVVAYRERSGTPGIETWHDRLRLDVAVGEHSEMFSWAGAKQFESGDLESLALSGSTGSGDFGSFLASIFGADAERFRYNGVQETPLGQLGAFDFSVPLNKSHYSYSGDNGQHRIVAYGGSIFADTATGELRRLVIDAHEFPPASDICRVQDTIDYARIKIGAGDFLLPGVSRMDVIYDTGQETLNETHYSGCHEFAGQSTIRFDDPDEPGTPASEAKAALKSIPPKTRIRVAIDPPVDSQSAAAGDPIEGVIERDVKMKGQTLLRASDKVHGRILRFEQFQFPDPRWIVAIRFESIERDGVEQPVRLFPLDDGVRGSTPQRFAGRRMQSTTPVAQDNAQHPPGSGLYIFYEIGRVRLDRKFHSDWETR